MPRKKVVEEKAKEGVTVTIDVEGFVRVRDSVVTGLAMLQDAIQTLSTTYIQHTNTFLGEHGAGHDVASALSKLGDNPLTGALQNLARASSVGPSTAAAAAGPPGSDKKERKKRQHDPNAPKRPLTPFFLYMQTARPIIAKDLGSDVAKGAVSTEGTRRWGTMAPDDKQLWTNAYRENLRLYNARMHSYKTGNPAAKDMSDEDALAYADSHNIEDAAPTADAQLVSEATTGALLEAEADADAEGEPEKEPTPPPKATPKAKAAPRKRAPKSTPAAATGVIVPPTPVVAAKEPEKEKSPDKKRKRASKKADEIVEPEAAAETPKSSAKPRKKKTKADA